MEVIPVSDQGGRPVTDFLKLIQHYKDTYDHSLITDESDSYMQKCSALHETVELSEHEILLVLSLLTNEKNYSKVKSILNTENHLCCDTILANDDNSQGKDDDTTDYCELKHRFSSLFYSNPILISQFKFIQNGSCPNCKSSLSFRDNIDIATYTYLPVEYYVDCPKCNFLLALERPLPQHMEKGE